MRTVQVSASKQYLVHIGLDLISQLGKFITEIHTCCKAAIISDSNVWPLYGEKAIHSLHAAGFSCFSFVFPAGEEHKNSTTYLDILDYLAKNELTRTDLIIALGGGVVGDIAGFAAATFLRGISYVQVPTTLLAMVDSSVGGKTAIDLPTGKNLVGAFKQPSLVLCDLNTLSTLPQNYFIDGCAEIVKYSMLYDPALLNYLTETGFSFDREAVIEKCIMWKRNAVQQDEYDNGARQKLNLGHTIGHAIEAGSNFTISHGHAVAAGMAIITKAAVKKGLCSESVYKTLVLALQKLLLPINTSFTADNLFSFAMSDKKRNGNSINLIVPRQIGHCDIVSMSVLDFKCFIEAGL